MRRVQALIVLPPFNIFSTNSVGFGTQRCECVHTDVREEDFMIIRKIIQTLLATGRLVRMFIEVPPINRC